MRTPLHQLHESDIQASEGGHRWLDLVRNLVLDIRSTTVDINPPNVNANDTVNVTVTVTGLRVGDFILQIIKPTTTSGLVVAQGIVTADDTVVMAFVNNKSGATDDPEETYTLIYIKNTRD